MAEPLALIRRRLGITQRDLAQRVGLTPGAIGQYEIGIRYPRFRTAKKIAQALGVSLDDIQFGPASATPETEHTQRPRSTIIVAD